MRYVSVLCNLTTVSVNWQNPERAYWVGACAVCTFAHRESACRRGTHSSFQLAVRLQHRRQDGPQVSTTMSTVGLLLGP